jgi:hypothetical protein
MKPWRSTILAAALFALTATSAASAQASDTTADLKCFVALSMVSDNADPSVNASITLGRLYFLGRLDGDAPSMDLKTRFREEAGKLTPADAKAELTRCGAILRNRAEVLQDIGRSLSTAPAAPKP